MEISKDTHFVDQENINPQSKQFGLPETCTQLCGTVGSLDYSELPNIL